MLSQKEKDEAFKRAKQKIEESGLSGKYDGEWEKANRYKKWHIMLGVEDLEGLTNEEIDEIVYDYKGRKYLWEQGTKKEGFNGKYKQ